MISSIILRVVQKMDKKKLFRQKILFRPFNLDTPTFMINLKNPLEPQIDVYPFETQSQHSPQIARKMLNKPIQGSYLTRKAICQEIIKTFTQDSNLEYLFTRLYRQGNYSIIIELLRRIDIQNIKKLKELFGLSQKKDIHNGIKFNFLLLLLQYIIYIHDLKKLHWNIPLGNGIEKILFIHFFSSKLGKIDDSHGKKMAYQNTFGVICGDGTLTSATGRGAGSHHKGIFLLIKIERSEDKLNYIQFQKYQRKDNYPPKQINQSKKFSCL